MSLCRRFNGKPVMRLIVSVPADDVQKVDRLLTQEPTRWLRSGYAEPRNNKAQRVMLG